MEQDDRSNRSRKTWKQSFSVISFFYLVVFVHSSCSSVHVIPECLLEEAFTCPEVSIMQSVSKYISMERKQSRNYCSHNNKILLLMETSRGCSKAKNNNKVIICTHFKQHIISLSTATLIWWIFQLIMSMIVSIVIII